LLCRLYQATPAQLGLRPPLPGEAATPPWLENGAHVGRRQLLKATAYAGEAAASSLVFSRLADAVSFSSLSTVGLSAQSAPRADMKVVRRRLDKHWQFYQSGVYRPILGQLPDLLSIIQGALTDARSEAPAQDLFDLQSRAYQLAASLAYKFGDPAVGLLAAERGVTAAGHASDILLGGIAVTRLAHGFRDTGHQERATDLTLRAASSLGADADVGNASRASVYGALLLHSSLAVAKRGDPTTASSLLAEAADVSKYTGEANHYYTAFGPTNVAVWGVAVGLQLGDSAAALKSADRVDTGQLPVAERKATFLVDRALANAYQGRRDAAAVDDLLSAERTAPDEVYNRREVQQVVEVLASRDRPTWRRPLRGLVERMSVTQ
jgi:hypothetical protein